MKLKRIISKAFVLSLILSNLPIDSFANNIENILQKDIKREELGDWISGLTSMPTSRNWLTSSVVDGKIYVIGGYNGEYLNNVEMYDPDTNAWETKADMPTARRSLTSSVIDGKIYVVGGYNGSELKKLEVYDPTTNTWETKADMPTARGYQLQSESINGKLYVIGGSSKYTNKVEVYDPTTDSWETKTPMPTGRGYFTTSVVDNKIYCIGGYNGVSVLNKIEVYDPITDSWETKADMPTARGYLTSSVMDGGIYVIGGANENNKIQMSTVEMYDPLTDTWETKTRMPDPTSYLTSEVVGEKVYAIGGGNSSSYSNKIQVFVKITDEQIAEDAVDRAEVSNSAYDIQFARNVVNSLPESTKKNLLQERLNALFLDISLETKNITSNLDLYIKCENMLLMSLDTNFITFDDFSGVTDMEKANAVNITVTSSLPYQINAYLPTEIQSSDKSNTMDKTIFNIKESSESTYQTFANTVDNIVLKDNCIAGNDIKHRIDVKLKGSIAHEKDVYKTTIKFEVQQK